MSSVTKPIMLDETGQAIKASIKEAASIIADKIKYGSTITIDVDNDNYIIK